MKIFARILCVLLSVLFAAGLFASSFAAILLSSVRGALTPSFVADAVNGLDFASVRFPDGFGGFTTIPEQMNKSFEPYGVSISDEQFNALCRDLGFDAVLRSYFTDFRAWLLDEGPIPQLDLRSAAENMVSGMDPDAMAFVSDPVAFAMTMLASYVNERALSSRLERLAPAREILSEGTLVFVLSVVLACAVLLFVSRGLKWLPTLTIGGLTAALSGAAAYFVPALAAPYKASLLGAAGVALESTFDIVYLPVVSAVSRAGLRVFIAGGAVFVLAGIGWIVVSAVKRSRQREAYDGGSDLL